MKLCSVIDNLSVSTYDSTRRHQGNPDRSGHPLNRTALEPARSSYPSTANWRGHPFVLIVCNGLAPWWGRRDTREESHGLYS